MKRIIPLAMDDIIEAVGDLLKKRGEVTQSGTITVWIQVKNGNATGVNVEFVPR